MFHIILFVTPSLLATLVNSLPNDKILDVTKSKVFTNDKLKICENDDFSL